MKIFLVVGKNHKAAEVTKRLQKSGLEFTKNPKEADCIFSVGGDGTFLYNARKYLDYERPIACINAGSVGFHCTIQPKDLDKDLKKIISKKNIELIKTIGVETESGFSDVAIQEIRIERSDHHAIVMEIKVGGKTIAKRHLGDGVIIANRLGTSGYSFSAGGPLKIKKDELVLTPICPYVLGSHIYDSVPKSKVYKNPKITITIEKEARLVLDNRAHLLSRGEKIDISLSKKSYKIYAK